MARRRTPVPRSPRGEGVIAVQAPIARLLGMTVGVPAYLALVRDGLLDLDGSHERMGFNSEPDAVQFMRGRGRHAIPASGLPDMKGLITWRRGARRWSLDVTHAMLAPDIHYWGVSHGRADLAQIRFDGVRLSETVMANIAGRLLRDIVDLPLLADPRIIVVDGSSGGPYAAMGPIGARPAMTQLRIEVPTETFPDPPEGASSRLARDPVSAL